MARFYAEIQGSRGEATRMGTAKTGISRHIRGWDVGIYVEGEVRANEDIFHVYLTSGSNGSRRKHLGTFTAADLTEDFTGRF